MTPEQRKELETLIDAIAEPETKEHYREQLVMAEDLEGDGLLTDSLPLTPVLRGEAEPVTYARTYVFQWFRRDELHAYDSLVVHTAGSERALALFEQNAACGALVHNEHVSPRCEILSLDADDCRTCFGAGKITVQGKRYMPCDNCKGSGKTKRR